MTKKKDKKWITKKRNDFYYKLAKKKNYRSRSTYKLFELNKKLGLIKEKDVVIDLGCAPGGWLQATRKIVGEERLVIGIDLLRIEPIKDKNVFAIKADIRTDETLKKVNVILTKKNIKKSDVVICDASPNISGIWGTDHARSISLAMTAFLTATKVLKNNGNFVVKLFQGYLSNEYVKMISGQFENVRIVKPLACRKNSAEIYLAGKKFKGKEFSVDSKSLIAELLELKF